MRLLAGEVDLIRVVLADANVLYSRVLRDYLLYAAGVELTPRPTADLISQLLGAE
nr:hypothetical protein [Micromonospora sp. DSM 115978]